ncbi:hypothetical protein EI94DRAFT_1440876, partial [Lactarius quietus]
LFLTDLLFSSPRLQFSVPQKRAILDWASQLGTPGIPTFHALSQSQDYIKGLIGDSVTAATTGMGHKIFIQDIPYMIAKDYANPLTRFAIWDYTIDGQGYAAQVLHGSKMLFDIEPALVVPTVSVNRHIFFVGELLQQSDGSYFIPERFFYRLPEGVKLSGNPSISDVAGFIVSDKKTSVHVDLFKRTFSDIQSNEQEFSCGFT